MSKLSRAIATIKKYQNRKSYDDFTPIEKFIVVAHANSKTPDEFVSIVSSLMNSSKTYPRQSSLKGEGK